MVLKTQDNKIPMDELNELEKQALESINAILARFPAVTVALKNFGEQAKKSSADFKKELVELNKEIKKGRAGYQDQLRALEQLNDSIEDAVKKNKSKAEIDRLQQQKQRLLEEAAWQNTREQLQQFGTELGKATIAGTGKFVRGLQDSASSTQLTSTILNAGIDIAAKGIASAGSAATGFGASMMNAKNPFVAGLGVVISGLGYVGKAAAEAGAGLAKFAVEIFAKELEKTVKSFHDISAGGALFTDGMEGMRIAAKDSKLTLEDFAGVISRQSTALGASGLSVPIAVKRMGGALAAGGDVMRKNLLNLGYRIEEHGDLVAETMMQMRQSGGPLMSSNAVVAEQTEKYAENLRVIAALTGEDAKTRSKAAQDQANQLAFQQKLAALPETQRAAVMRAYTAADAVTRKNFMDLVNFGSVINTQGAILTAQLPAQREKQDRMFMLYNQRMLDEESFRQIQKDTNGRIQKELTDQYGAMGAIAQVQAAGYGGEIAEVAQMGMEILKEVAPDAAAITAAETLAKEQRDTTNKLTSDMNDAAIAAKDLAIALQQVTLELLPKAAEINKATLETFKDYVAKVFGAKPPPPKSASQEPETARRIYSVDPKTGKITASNAEAAAASQADVGFNPAFADGGVSKGPVSGYSATLHGTEAVVPLPDNRSIPVSLDSSSITAAVHQQSGILAEILRAMQNNNSIASQIAMNTV